MLNPLHDYFQEFIEVRLRHGWLDKKTKSSKKLVRNVYTRLRMGNGIEYQNVM